MNTPQRRFLGNYVSGAFALPAQANGELKSSNPGDLDAAVVDCPFSFEAVGDAVESAESAAASWRRLTLSDRQAALARYRGCLGKAQDEIAALISFETGKPYWESQEEVQETLSTIDFYLDSAQKTPLESPLEAQPDGATTRVSHFPRGVAAVISPGINPVCDAHLHLVPALLYGNPVVFKASRHAPLVGQAVAEAAHQAGFPVGVFNMVQGDAELARRLVSHPDIQSVFFTGSCETGLMIKKQILSDFWKVAVLDMVGKNGVLLWKDCQYEQALLETLYSAFLTSGQRRTTANRVLVHRSLIDRFQADFHALSKKISIGYGLAESAPFLGPLLNDTAVENYIRYQGIAVREGCEEIMRGKSLERQPKGHYVSPSIHLVTRVDPKSVYQKSEIFGPNIALYAFDDIEEAIEILNLSQHGLVASIYAKDRAVFQRACEEVRVGTLHWNQPTHTATYRLPRVGHKKSGNARPLGSLAWQQCTYPVVATEKAAPKAELPAALPRSSKP
ncbi:aldehyde dehydrogenase family protein [bacterium]|nr:aldehyde dehydrogenase family protein [bacterium]